jgi:hypothetical protein
MTTTYDDINVTYDDSSLTYQGLPAQFDGISFAVEMAFGYEPLDDDPSWESVTPYVRGFDINRGRNSEFSTYGPGTVSIALDNRDRRFDPEHTTGPYFGQLNPMVPVRVQATYNSVTYTMFYGFVQGWPTIYNQSNTDAVATITAIDATRLLGNIPLPRSLYYDTIIADSPSYYWDFESPSNQDQYDLVQNLRLTYLTAAAPTPQSFTSNLPIELPTMANTGGHFRTATSVPENIRTIEFWTDAGKIAETGASPGDILLYRSQTDQFSVSVDATKRLFEVRFTNPVINRNMQVFPGASTPFTNNQSNHIVVTLTTAGSMQYYINGVFATANSTSTGTASFSAFSNISINIISSAISNVAMYTSALSASRVAAHYAAGAVAFGGELSSARLTRVLDDAGWPSAWRDVETGVQTVGAYRPAGLPIGRYMEQVGNAEQGSLFVNREGDVEFRSRSTADAVNVVGLFDDSGTDLPFANVSVDSNTVDAIRNRVDGQFAVGTVTAIDATSVAAYGEASESVDLGLIDDPVVAQSVVDARLARTKDPRTRITRLDVNVRRDPAGLVPVVAALDLSDDVTVSLTPTGVGSALWRAVRVQGISHRVTPQSWDVSLYLAPGPVNTNGPLLILDDGTYGELDANKLG